MGCSQGPVNNNCSSRQSFCILGRQLVSQNVGISASIGNIEGFAEAKNWEKIKKVLENIKNYGDRGTRNPTNTDINKMLKVEQNDFTYLNIYNTIIKILQTGTNNINIKNGKLLNIEEFLTQEQMKKLQSYINNYKLNEDRCNSCNTQCNTTCQAAVQCGSCESTAQNCEDQWGGGGGCGMHCIDGGSCNSWELGHFDGGYF